MKMLILGGDERYINIIDFFNSKCLVDTVGYKKIYSDSLQNIESLKEYDIIILPMGGISNDYKISSLDGLIDIKNIDLNNKSIVYTGLITDKVKEIFDKDKIISFLKDKTISDSNDDITVKGIIDKIKDKKQDNICILGYGNIGKKLYEQLDKSNNIKIGVKEKIDYDKLGNISFYTKYTKCFESVLSVSDIIINTVPCNIIDENLIKKINKNSYFLDIASYPHGINKDLTSSINYELYLGIPGKYDPKSSSKILLKKLNNEIGGI